MARFSLDELREAYEHSRGYLMSVRRPPTTTRSPISSPRTAHTSSMSSARCMAGRPSANGSCR